MLKSGTERDCLDMYIPFFDDPVKTYEYYNFLPYARDDLKDNDDVVVLPPDARYLTDEEELGRKATDGKWNVTGCFWSFIAVSPKFN
ncbi:unnamed protein product [Acanthoscelides obtectus]|uniref:Uncharacterized protein n=1 Tax=Acanthoscelides obtectus TaxID=200917 RepID=A0A9P0K623_ACAOB|nr:unnamed protein product [Acanthoscelides obtectus]CAK1653188.1 hypothetical protein AOBTE_LOCUS18113 [Acanthoscelides obtectus]